MSENWRSFQEIIAEHPMLAALYARMSDEQKVEAEARYNTMQRAMNTPDEGREAWLRDVGSIPSDG